MAENTKRIAAAAAADGGDGAPSTGENLEKVRDILFGSQMRDHDRRFARIEERLNQDMTELRDETRKRLDSLEAYIKREVQSVLDRVKAEQTQRTDALKQVGQDLKEASRAMEQRAGELEELNTQTQRELRDALLEQSKTLRDEVQQAGRDTTNRLEATADELRADKVDRGALAGLFNELAMRLSESDAAE
jgi:hypothetical protein